VKELEALSSHVKVVEFSQEPIKYSKHDYIEKEYVNFRANYRNVRAISSKYSMMEVSAIVAGTPQRKLSLSIQLIPGTQSTPSTKTPSTSTTRTLRDMDRTISTLESTSLNSSSPVCDRIYAEVDYSQSLYAAPPSLGDAWDPR